MLKNFLVAALVALNAGMALSHGDKDHECEGGDTQPPEISLVTAIDNPNHVIVSFTEPVDPITAELPSNYSVDGITVIGASLSDGGLRADLTLDTELSEGITYPLTVNNIEDLAGNIIALNTQEQFDFVDIPDEDMTLWLRADGKVIIDADDKVFSWNDHSGNSNNVEQFQDTAYQPVLIYEAVNEKPAVAFDGINDYLYRQFTPDLETDTFTWFVVFRVNDEFKEQNIIRNAYAKGAKGSSKEMWGTFIRDGAVYGHGASSEGDIKTAAHLIDREYHLQSVTWNSNDEITGFLDGENEDVIQGADAVPEKHLRLRIGVNSKDKQNYLDGEIAEIIVYSRDLSPEERAEVEAYLQTKYFGPVDTDKDGLPDEWEMEHFGNLDQGAEDDPDADSLTNLEEFNAGTDPVNPDTDGDRMPDGWELENGLDPLAADALLDSDEDGAGNLMEYLLGRNPLIKGTPDTENILQFRLYTPLS